MSINNQQTSIKTVQMQPVVNNVIELGFAIAIFSVIIGVTALLIVISIFLFEKFL